MLLFLQATNVFF